jgi:hypothetical protein
MSPADGLGYNFLLQAWGCGYAAEACAAAFDWYAGAFPSEPVVLRTPDRQRPLDAPRRLGFPAVERFEGYGAEQWFGVGIRHAVRLSWGLNCRCEVRQMLILLPPVDVTSTLCSRREQGVTRTAINSPPFIGYKAARPLARGATLRDAHYRGCVPDEDSLVMPAPWWRRVHLRPRSVGNV